MSPAHRMKRVRPYRIHSGVGGLHSRGLYFEVLEDRRLLSADLAPAQGIQVATRRGVVHPSGPYNAELSDTPPEISAHPYCGEVLPDHSDHSGQSAQNSSIAGNAAPPSPDDSFSAADDLVIYRDRTIPVAMNLSSPTNEPSLGTLDSTVFQTGNWYASISQDNGKTFQYIDPFTTFPASWGGFCCDQRVAQDERRDLLIWYLQYNKSGSGANDTNGVRIALAKSEAEAGVQPWFTYNFGPQSFGYSLGNWLDFPNLEVSDNYLYATSNVFTTTTNANVGSVWWRLSLDELYNHESLNYYYYTTTEGTIGLVEGATDTMYAAINLSNATLRFLSWVEGTSTVTPYLLDVYNDSTGTHTATDVDGNNWTGKSDNRIQTGWVSGDYVGFLWNSAANGTNRPFPFVRGALIQPSLIGVSVFPVVASPDLWSPAGAFHYPSTAVNARGEVAGSVGYATNNGPIETLLFYSDFSTFANPWTTIRGAAGTNGPGQNRWGDYLDAQADDNYPNTWIASGFVHNGARTIPHFFWFGKEADRPPADLRGYLFNVGQAAVQAGATIALSMKVENIGLDAAGSSTASLYLSRDATIGTNDKLLGTILVPGLAANAVSALLSKSFTLPGKDDPFWTGGNGSYYVGARIDSPRAITELDEANNSNQGVAKDSDTLHVNVPPKITLSGTRSYTENAAAVTLAPTATIVDTDSPDFAGGQLRVAIIANANSQDRLEVRGGSTTIGTVSGGVGNQPLVIALNASATVATTRVLLRGITFHTLGDAPSSDPRTLRLTLNDGDGGTSAPRDITMNVVAVNDRPTLANFGGAVGYRLNRSPIQLTSTATVTDPDSADFDGGRLTLHYVSGADSSDRLLVGGAFSLSGNNVVYNGTTVIGTRNGGGGVGTNDLVVMFNADATRAIVQLLIRSIRYRTFQGVSTAQRVIEFSLTDGDSGTSNVVTKRINVTE